MKVKVILKSLLFSYAVTGAFLLFLAFLLFQFDLGEKACVSRNCSCVYFVLFFRRLHVRKKFCAKISIYGEFW